MHTIQSSNPHTCEVDLEAAVQQEAVHLISPHAPAHAVARLQHDRLQAGCAQDARRVQARQPSAHHHHIRCRRRRARRCSRCGAGASRACGELLLLQGLPPRCCCKGEGLPLSGGSAAPTLVPGLHQRLAACGCVEWLRCGGCARGEIVGAAAAGEQFPVAGLNVAGWGWLMLLCLRGCGARL
jgi:hypothetical protein